MEIVFQGKVNGASTEVSLTLFSHEERIPPEDVLALLRLLVTAEEITLDWEKDFLDELG
jgi:hypothetical protein